MYFCIMNDTFVNIKTAQRYIKIEVSNQNNIDKFVKKVFEADIYGKPEPILNTETTIQKLQNFSKTSLTC